VVRHNLVLSLIAELLRVSGLVICGYPLPPISLIDHHRLLMLERDEAAAARPKVAKRTATAHSASFACSLRSLSPQYWAASHINELPYTG
jgi:hypothetical protein